MARRRTSEATQTLPDTLPESSIESTDFHFGAAPQNGNRHEATATTPAVPSSSGELSTVGTLAAETSAAAPLNATREPATDRAMNRRGHNCRTR